MVTQGKTYATTCRMCGSLCGILAHIKDNKLVEVEGNPDHVISKGRICIKGSSAATWLNLPERLQHPLKRNAHGDFEEIELEQAMDEIATKLLELQNRYGANSIGVWKGEGIDFAQQEGLARRFIHAIGSPNYFSNDTQCYASRHIAFHLVYGCWPEADYANSRLIINWGTNTPISHAPWMQAINTGRDSGAKMLVIDTRYTELACQADLFILLNPGSDGALAWGIMREMIRRGEIDEEFINRFTLGFDKLKAYAQQFDPERVAEICHIDPSIIGRVVDMIAAARPYLTSWAGTGLEHHINGVNNIRAVTMIDTLAGAIDRKGGMRIPARFNFNSLPIYKEKPLLDLMPIGRDRFPVIYDMRQECHTLTLMNQIITSDPYPFKGLVMTAANPALTNANSNKVIKALSALDLLVVKDLFFTETAKLAHYVLPAASYLEREELFTNGARNTAFITGKYLDYGFQTELGLFKGLATRMGAGEYFPWQDDHELTEYILEPSGFTTEDLKKAPGGFCFGPNEYEKHLLREKQGLPPFNTPSGKIELFCQYLEDKQRPYLTGLPEYFPPNYQQYQDENYPLLMSSGARKQKYFHGRYRNVPQLYLAEPHGCLEMHPEDAQRLMLEDGDKVKVSSRIGSFTTQVQIRAAGEILPGYVQHTHGFANENVNLITYDDVCDPVSGFPVLNAVMVRVDKL